PMCPEDPIEKEATPAPAHTRARRPIPARRQTTVLSNRLRNYRFGADPPELNEATLSGPTPRATSLTTRPPMQGRNFHSGAVASPDRESRPMLCALRVRVVAPPRAKEKCRPD